MKIYSTHYTIDFRTQMRLGTHDMGETPRRAIITMDLTDIGSSVWLTFNIYLLTHIIPDSA